MHACPIRPTAKPSSLILLTALLLTAAFSSAQSAADFQNGTNFQGRVNYGNNMPAANVLVELWSDGETTWRTFATTDDTGKFHTGAPCMVIQYKIEAPGMQPAYGRTDMSMVPCRALESVTLRPKPGSNYPENAYPPGTIVDARIAAIPDEAKTEFDAGQQALTANDLAAATTHLQKAIELYPRFAEAYQLLAVVQIQNKQGAQAEASLIKALAIEDKLPRAQYLLGALYGVTGRADLAEKPLTRFAQLDPKNPDAHFELAKVGFALKKYDASELHARKSIALKETNPGVNIVLGYALLRQGKADDAKQAFQQFLKLDPNGPMAPDVKNTLAKIEQLARR